MNYTIIDINENVLARNIIGKQALYAWATKHANYAPINTTVHAHHTVVVVDFKSRM